MISPSNVPKRFNKTRKFAWWHILLFTTLLLVLLLLLFPKKLLIHSLINNPNPNELSIVYLKNLVALQPQNMQLKLALAQQELTLGNLESAANVITPYITLTPRSSAQWQALWIYYQIIRTQAYALPEKNPTRVKNENRMKDLLPVLSQSPYLNAQMVSSMAKDALALNQVKTALTLYDMSEKLTINNPPEFFAHAGKIALFISDYKRSAGFYLRAMQTSTSIGQKRLYFISGLQSLMAGNDFSTAINFAQQHIDGLSKDQATLIFLAKMGMSANRPDVAQYYIKQVLQFKYQRTDDVAKEM